MIQMLGRFLLLAPFFVSGCDTPPPSPGIDAETTQQLLARLDRLVTVLQQNGTNSSLATGAVKPPEPEPAVRVDAEDSVATLRARIQALEQEVHVLRDAAGAVGVAPASRPVAPAKLAARVEQLHDGITNEATRVETVRSLFLRSRRQVAEQLGMPDHVYSGTGTIKWRYEVGGKRFEVVFDDDFAIRIEAN
jgi:hypothetical protein